MSDARTMKESVEWHGIVCLGLGRHCGESGSITNRSTVQHPAQVTGDDEVTQPQEYAHTFHTRTHTHVYVYIYIGVCVYTRQNSRQHVGCIFAQDWQRSDLGFSSLTAVRFGIKKFNKIENFPASCPEMFNQSPRLKIEAWNSVELSEDFWTKPPWNLQC